MKDAQTPTLGEVIIAKRTALGISQRELAKMIGFNNSTISRLEKDTGIVADPSTLRAIAQALRLDYNYLLSLNKTVDDNPDLRIIARASKKMSEEQRQKMMKMLKSEFEDAFTDTESDGWNDGGDW